jgi:hypothetical protein
MIAWVSVRLLKGSFLIGLSAHEVESDLLKEGRWLDIPIIYSDGRRAILAIEKGSTGERAFSDVLASWSRSP